MSLLSWLFKCFASARAEHQNTELSAAPPPCGPVQQVSGRSAVAETPQGGSSGRLSADGALISACSEQALDPAPASAEEHQQQPLQHAVSQSNAERSASQPQSPESLQPASSVGGQHAPLRSAPQEVGQPLDPRIRVPFNEIRLYSVIGKGSFKTVYRGAWNNTHVAVVAMRRGGLVAEARLLQRLSTHPNLVQLYRWSADESGNEYLVMELLPLGSLDAVLRSIGRQLLTQTKMTVVEQLASACLELAHEGLVHGDLAARNLLVKSLEPPHVKLADFGLSRPAALPGHAAEEGPSSFDVPVTAAPQAVVPARWAAPEVLAGEPPSEAADVWSFGVVCWEIFSNGAEPYASLSNREILNALRSGYRLERPRGCPVELWGLVQTCWRDQPRERPSFTAITTTLRNWREAYVSSRVAMRAAAAGSQTASALAAGLPPGATLPASMPVRSAGAVPAARGQSGVSATLPGDHAPGTDSSRGPSTSGPRGSRVPAAGAAPRSLARPPPAAPATATAAGAAAGYSGTRRPMPTSPPQDHDATAFDAPTFSPPPLSRALAGVAAPEPQHLALRRVLPALATGDSGTGSGTGSVRGDVAGSTGFVTPTGAAAAVGASGSVTGGMSLWAPAGAQTGRGGGGPSGIHLSTHMSFEVGEPPIQPVLDTASSIQVSGANALPSAAAAAAAAPPPTSADLAVAAQAAANALLQQPSQDVRMVSSDTAAGVASSNRHRVQREPDPAAANQSPTAAAPARTRVPSEASGVGTAATPVGAMPVMPANGPSNPSGSADFHRSILPPPGTGLLGGAALISVPRPSMAAAAAGVASSSPVPSSPLPPLQQQGPVGLTKTQQGPVGFLPVPSHEDLFAQLRHVQHAVCPSQSSTTYSPSIPGASFFEPSIENRTNRSNLTSEPGDGLGGAGTGGGRDSHTRSTILSGMPDSHRPSDSSRSGGIYSARAPGAGGVYSGRGGAGPGGQRHTLGGLGLASGPGGSTAAAAGSGLPGAGAGAGDHQRLDRSHSSDSRPGVTLELLMQQQLAGAAAVAAAAAAGAPHVCGGAAGISPAAAVLDTSPYVRIRDLTSLALPAPAAAAAAATALAAPRSASTQAPGSQGAMDAKIRDAEALVLRSRRPAGVQLRSETAGAAEAATPDPPRDTAAAAAASSPIPESPFVVGASQQRQQRHEMQPGQQVPQQQPPAASSSNQEGVTIVNMQAPGAGGIAVGGVGSSTTEDLSFRNMPRFTSSAGTFAFASARRRSSAQALVGGRPSAAGTESTATLFGPPIGSTQRLPSGVFCLPSGAHDADQMGVSTSQLSINRLQLQLGLLPLQGLGGQAFQDAVVEEQENEGVDDTDEEELEAARISVDAPMSQGEAVPPSPPRPHVPAGLSAGAVSSQASQRLRSASATAAADAMASAAAAAAVAVAKLGSGDGGGVDVDVETAARPGFPGMLAAGRGSIAEPVARGEARAITAAPAGASQHLSLGPGDHDEVETMAEEWVHAEVSATISRTGINGGPGSSRQEGAVPSAMATGAVPSGSSAVATGGSHVLAGGGEELPASGGGVINYANTSALAASLASDLRTSAASRLHVLQPTPSRLRAFARRHDAKEVRQEPGSESPALDCPPSPSPSPVQQQGSLTLVRQRMPLIAPATSAVLACEQTRRRRRGSNGSSRTSGSHRCRSLAGSVASSYASSRSRKPGHSSNRRSTLVVPGAGQGTVSDAVGGLHGAATGGGRSSGRTTTGLGVTSAVAPAFLLGTAPAALEGWRPGPLSPSSLSSRSARTAMSTLHSSWSGLLNIGPEPPGAPPAPPPATASGGEAAAASSGQTAAGFAGGAQSRRDPARAAPGLDAARTPSRELQAIATSSAAVRSPAPQMGPGSGGGGGGTTVSTLSGGQLLSTEQNGTSGRTLQQGAGTAAARGSRDSQGTGATGNTANTGTTGHVGMLMGRSGGFIELLQELPLSGSDLMPVASASSGPFALPATGTADPSASNAGSAGTNLAAAPGAVPASPSGGVGMPARPVAAGGAGVMAAGGTAAPGGPMGVGAAAAGPRSLFVARGYAAAAPLYGSLDTSASPPSGAPTGASACLVSGAPPGVGTSPGGGLPAAADVVRAALAPGSGGTSGTEGGGTLPGVALDEQMEAAGVGPPAGLYGTAVTGSSGFVVMPGSSGLGSRSVLFNYAGPITAQQAAAAVNSPFTPAAFTAAARAAGGAPAAAGMPAAASSGVHYTVHNPALAGGAAARGGSGTDGGIGGFQALMRRGTSTMLLTPPLTAVPSAASYDYLVMQTLGSTAETFQVQVQGGGAGGGAQPSLAAGAPSAGVYGNVAEWLAAYRADALPAATHLPVVAEAAGQQDINFGAAELAAWLAGAGTSSPGGGGSAGDGSSHGPLGASYEAAAIAQLQQLHQQHQMRQQQLQQQQQQLSQQQQMLARRPQLLDVSERGGGATTSDAREPAYGLSGPDAVATERVAIFAWMQQRTLEQMNEERSW